MYMIQHFQCSQLQDMTLQSMYFHFLCPSTVLTSTESTHSTIHWNQVMQCLDTQLSTHIMLDHHYTLETNNLSLHKNLHFQHSSMCQTDMECTHSTNLKSTLRFLHSQLHMYMIQIPQNILR